MSKSYTVGYMPKPSYSGTKYEELKDVLKESGIISENTPDNAIPTVVEESLVDLKPENIKYGTQIGTVVGSIKTKLDDYTDENLVTYPYNENDYTYIWYSRNGVDAYGVSETLKGLFYINLKTLELIQIDNTSDYTYMRRFIIEDDNNNLYISGGMYQIYKINKTNVTKYKVPSTEYVYGAIFNNNLYISNSYLASKKSIVRINLDTDEVVIISSSVSGVKFKQRYDGIIFLEYKDNYVDSGPGLTIIENDTCRTLVYGAAYTSVFIASDGSVYAGSTSSSQTKAIIRINLDLSIETMWEKGYFWEYFFEDSKGHVICGCSGYNNLYNNGLVWVNNPNGASKIINNTSLGYYGVFYESKQGYVYAASQRNYSMYYLNFDSGTAASIGSYYNPKFYETDDYHILVVNNYSSASNRVGHIYNNKNTAFSSELNGKGIKFTDIVKNEQDGNYYTSIVDTSGAGILKITISGATATAKLIHKKGNDYKYHKQLEQGLLLSTTEGVSFDSNIVLIKDGIAYKVKL